MALGPSLENSSQSLLTGGRLRLWLGVLALAALMGSGVGAGTGAGTGSVPDSKAGSPEDSLLPVVRQDGDFGHRRAVLVEADPAPGLSVELAGVYPHATNDDLYWLLTNKVTAYMANQQPYLPSEHRGRLLLVERRTAKIVDSYPLTLGHYGGLASDGRNLFVSNLHPPEILEVDPESGKIVHRFPVSGQVGGLEYDRERSVLIAQLYLQYPHLAELDPKSGKLLRVLWSEESTMGIAMVRGDLISTWSGRGHFAAGSELHFHDRETGKILHRAPFSGVHGAMAPLDAKVAGYEGFLSIAVRDVDLPGHTEVRRYRYVTAEEYAAMAAAGTLKLSASSSASAGRGEAETFAAVQYAPVPGRVEHNRQRLAELIEQAARAGARYVVLPELAVTGALAAADGQPTFETVPTEPIPGPTTEFFARLAARHRVWLVVPVIEEAPYLSSYFVTAVLLDDQGRILHKVRKILPDASGAEGEFTRGAAGTVVETVDTGRRRVGVLFGDDLMIGAPRLTDLGADVLLVPAGWQSHELYEWSRLADELSSEHKVSLVVANRVLTGRLGGIYPRLGDPDPAGQTDPETRDAERGYLAMATIPPPEHLMEPPTSLGLPMMPIPRRSAFSRELVELGRELFFDPNLSRIGDLACASCHRPDDFFADDKPLTAGLYGKLTMRNVPSLLNVGMKGSLFWDGYVASLESQAKYPMVHVDEMDVRLLDNVEEYVRSQPQYRERLAALTATREEDLTIEEVTLALASYQRTLISGNSAFDRYYYGGDEEALDPSARRGLELFQGQAGCASCHLIGSRYALFTDQDFHITGVGYDPELDRFTDVGAGINSYEGKGGVFLTPSLRNVAETAPYMHDGSMATLAEVVSYYDRGGNQAPNLDGKLQPLELTAQEQQDLIAFLRSLTGAERYDSRGQLIVDTPEPEPDHVRSQVAPPTSTTVER